MAKSAWCSGCDVCMMTVPLFSELLPALPATCVSNWYVLSDARKSGRKSAMSALMTATRVTCGKSSPFATI